LRLLKIIVEAGKEANPEKTSRVSEPREILDVLLLLIGAALVIDRKRRQALKS